MKGKGSCQLGKRHLLTAYTCFSRSPIYRHFSLIKLVIKPDSLLLEDRRSETSSEGHNQTTTLLFIELATELTFIDFQMYHPLLRKTID